MQRLGRNRKHEQTHRKPRVCGRYIAETLPNQIFALIKCRNITAIAK